VGAAIGRLAVWGWAHAVGVQVSFKDGEGWIIGKPPILLHTQVKAS
jgi:photosystem II stability/assembly factor-like uncharacterized protein